MHIPKSACTVNKVSFFSSRFWILKLQVAKSDITSLRHRFISPPGAWEGGKGRRWDGGRRKRRGGLGVGWWRGGVIGLLLCQVCFSHKHTYPLPFHSSVGGGVKNDKARHWSRHDRELLQLQWRVPTHLTVAGWTFANTVHSLKSSSCPTHDAFIAWVITGMYGLQILIRKMITYCKSHGSLNGQKSAWYLGCGVE